ncbi:hypothetical protein [Nostoc sp.]
MIPTVVAPHTPDAPGRPLQPFPNGTPWGERASTAGASLSRMGE